jgi:outer membrane protein
MRVMRPEIRNRVWEAGFQVSVPLYMGGRLFADTRKAVSMSEVNRQQLQSVKDQTKFETQAAFLGLRNSVAALKAAEQSVRSATTSLESTRKGYEVGTRTMVDVLDRIRDLQQTKRECNLARYYHILARIRLKKASGTLSDQDIASLNALIATAGEKAKSSEKH